MSYPKRLARIRPTRGLAADLPASEIGDEFYSEVFNVRFPQGLAERSRGQVEVYASPTAAPLELISARTPDADFWVYVSAAAQWAVDSSGHSDVSMVGLNEQDRAHLHSLCRLNGVTCHNNALDVPMFWPGLKTSPFEPLPGWPAGDVCQRLVPHLAFLFALDIDGPDGRFPSLLRWSDAAEPGTIPNTWAPAADNLAGSAELSDSPGGLRTAATLRDALVIYKADAVWIADFVGAPEVFRFRPLFHNVGVISPRAVASGPQGHIFVTANDVMQTDGNAVRSIADARVRSLLFDNLNQTRADDVLAWYNPLRRETHIGFPIDVGTYSNRVLIYSHDADAWGYGDGGGVSAAAVGVVIDLGEPIPAAVQAPVFTPGEGIYPGHVVVTITCETPASTTRYTTDGSSPGPDSEIYTGPIEFTASAVLRAYSTAAGLRDSDHTSASYTVTAQQAGAPLITPAAGSYPNSVQVTIQPPDQVVPYAIWYTTNGATPTPSSGTLYSGPFVLTSSATVKAVATADYYVDSDVSSVAYTVVTQTVATPVMTPAAGSYVGHVVVSMTCATPGADIRYTDDGSAPNATSPIYSPPLDVLTTSTIKAIGVKAGMFDSAVVSQAYTITAEGVNPVRWDWYVGNPEGNGLLGWVISSTSGDPTTGEGARIALEGTGIRIHDTSPSLVPGFTKTTVTPGQTGETWRYIAIRVRAWPGTASPAQNLIFQWRDAVETWATGKAQTITPITTEWQELVFDMWKNSSAADWRSKEITDIRFRVGTGGSGLCDMEIDWFEIRPDDGAP